MNPTVFYSQFSFLIDFVLVLCNDGKKSGTRSKKNRKHKTKRTTTAATSTLMSTSLTVQATSSTASPATSLRTHVSHRLIDRKRETYAQVTVRRSGGRGRDLGLIKSKAKGLLPCVDVVAESYIKSVQSISPFFDKTFWSCTCTTCS